MTKYKKILFRIVSLALILSLSLINNQTIFALDTQFYSSNKIYYYDDRDCLVNGGSSGSSADISVTGSTTGTVKSFTEAYVQAAYEIGKKNGIPWEAIMGQAGLESGWGKSGLTQQANNFFGIKAGSSWTGPTVTMRTAEQTSSGGTYHVNAAFRKYATPQEGFQGYAEFIHNNSRYKKALQYPGDPQKYITEIRAAGYATDVKYVDKVMSAIQSIVNSLGSQYGTTYKKSSDLVASGEMQTQQPASGSVDDNSSDDPDSNSNDNSSSGSSCVCQASPNVGDSASLEGDSNAEKAYNFFVSKGFSPAGAAGIVGNFMLESGGNTFNLDPKIKNSAGYTGIAQWDPKGRWPKLVSWAKQQNKDEWALGTQLEYVMYEINNDNSYKSLLAYMKNASSPGDAAREFDKVFERGGHRDVRAKNAEKAYSSFSGNSVGDTTSVDVDSGSSTNDPAVSSSGCGGGSSGSATIVGDSAFPLGGTKKSVNNPGMFKNGTTDRGGHPYIAYDILADPGVPVVAMLSGTVKRISTDKCPGRLISIYNQENNRTISYLHLDIGKTMVSEGQSVTVGQQVGVVGPPAAGCGIPHLHIDSANGAKRPGCKRESCPMENRKLFQDIGPDLFKLFQAMPN